MNLAEHDPEDSMSTFLSREKKRRAPNLGLKRSNSAEVQKFMPVDVRAFQ